MTELATSMPTSAMATAEPAARLSLPGFDLLCSLIEGVAVGMAGAAMALARDAVGIAVPFPGAGLDMAAGAGYVCLVWLLQVFPRGRAALHNRALAETLRVMLALFVCLVLSQPDVSAMSPGRLATWLAWFLSAASAVALIRRAEISVGARVVAPRHLRQLAVIIGNGPNAMRLVETMRARAQQDFELLGYFDDRYGRTGPLDGTLPYLGDLAALIALIEETDDLNVFIALPWTAGTRIAQLLERLRFLPVVVRLTPDIDVTALTVSQASQTDSILMPTLMTPPFSAWGRFCKTALDLSLGSIALLLVSPILLITAILIKLDSPGPVMFRQMRSGQFGRKFSIYKFRSLHVAQQDAEAAKLVTKGDSRVTRVGHYIRKYSIDELPQIFNVLRGEMSLVGPRPHAPKAKADGRLYADVVPDYALRYRVKPGMTGWAQINGWRGETDTEEKLRKRVEFDFYYITHWRFWLDVTILARTLPVMLLPQDGARRGRATTL